ncbi:MAG: hypothetical protein PF795_01890 [Kiritimatiellae bacterium]|jgi:hypothetical protein|nr:hypothetical protein [Kiritimatiellia bacterium]
MSTKVLGDAGGYIVLSPIRKFPFIFLITLLLTSTGAMGIQTSLPPKYDESVLKEQFHEFMAKLDPLIISRDYPGAIRNLLSSDLSEQIVAMKILSETGEVEVIPWLLPFLESENRNLRSSAGLSLNKLVSSRF